MRELELARSSGILVSFAVQDLNLWLIQRKAFELWKDAGEPNGMMETFWYRAEKELLQRRGDDKPAEAPTFTE